MSLFNRKMSKLMRYWKILFLQLHKPSTKMIQLYRLDFQEHLTTYLIICPEILKQEKFDQSNLLKTHVFWVADYEIRELDVSMVETPPKILKTLFKGTCFTIIT